MGCDSGKPRRLAGQGAEPHDDRMSENAHAPESPPERDPENDPNLATRAEVEALLASRGNVVDVLELQHYQKQHIPGAISLPLAQLAERASKTLRDRSQAIIVYCGGYT